MDVPKRDDGRKEYLLMRVVVAHVALLGAGYALGKWHDFEAGHLGLMLLIALLIPVSLAFWIGVVWTRVPSNDRNAVRLLLAVLLVIAVVTGVSRVVHHPSSVLGTVLAWALLLMIGAAPFAAGRAVAARRCPAAAGGTGIPGGDGG